MARKFLKREIDGVEENERERDGKKERRESEKENRKSQFLPQRGKHGNDEGDK